MADWNMKNFLIASVLFVAFFAAGCEKEEEPSLKKSGSSVVECTNARILGYPGILRIEKIPTEEVEKVKKTFEKLTENRRIKKRMRCDDGIKITN